MEIYNIAKAKNKFTFFRRMAAQGNEFIVIDDKRADSKPVSIISTELLNRVSKDALSNLTYKWLEKPGDIITGTEKNETWNLWNNQLNIIGVGLTKEEAIDRLAEDAVNYAEEYFNDLEFFLNPKSQRDGHYWLLRGIKQCNGNIEEVKEVMGLKQFLNSENN